MHIAYKHECRDDLVELVQRYGGTVIDSAVLIKLADDIAKAAKNDLHRRLGIANSPSQSVKRQGSSDELSNIIAVAHPSGFRRTNYLLCVALGK
jgi:hypothetical protein